MPITVEAKDKRVKAVMAAKFGASVAGLQPQISIKIRIRIDVMRVSNSMKEIKDAHPEWRPHEWKGKKDYWSLDVTGNTRLLFDFDAKTLKATNMIYDDPH